MHDFNDIRHYASRLVGRYNERDLMDEELRQMFAMEWQKAPQADWVKRTMSPTAYNTTIGAIRLLTATEPQLSVPFDESDATARAASEKVEQAAKAMWSGSGRVGLRPVHYEIVFSAVLFGEVCATVTKTADLLRYAEKAGNKATANRMRYVAQETPYLFQVYNPSTCYPDFDRFGLRAVLRRTKSTWGEIYDAWGKMAEKAWPGDHQKDEAITVNDWYDWENRAVWLDGGGFGTVGTSNTAGQTRAVLAALSNEPILFEPHELEFMPVVAQIGEGSFMFDRPEQQRLPFLYSMWKSGLWKRENLALTILYSLIFALGSNPLLKRTTSTPGVPLVIDRSIPGGVIDLAQDERLDPFIQQVFDPAMMQGLDLAKRLNTESTIPTMALGQPPGISMAFSAISLLSQSGRLPLVAPKELSGAAISNLIIAALRWMKQDGENEKFYRKGVVVELSPNDIPDRIVVNCNLEPDLPTDKMQQANIASLIVASELASRRWTRENILNIGQSGAMDKEIWTEKRLAVELQRVIEMIKAEDQAKIQAMMASVQAQMAQQAQGGGPGGPPMGQPPPQVGQSPFSGGMGGPSGAGPGPEQLAAMRAAMAQQQGAAPPGAEDQMAMIQQMLAQRGGGQLPPEVLAQLQEQLQGQGPYPPGGQVGPGAPLTGPLPPIGAPPIR